MQGLGSWQCRSQHVFNRRRMHSPVLRQLAVAHRAPFNAPRKWACFSAAQRCQTVQGARSPRAGIFGGQQRRCHALRAVQTTEVETRRPGTKEATAGASGSDDAGYGISVADLQCLAEAAPQDVFSGAVSSADKLAKLLSTSLEQGISTGEADMQQRRRMLGSNRLPERQQARQSSHVHAC